MSPALAAGRFLAVAGWLAGVLGGWRAAGGELGLQAVEDGLEAQLESVFGRRDDLAAYELLSSCSVAAAKTCVW